MKYLAISHAYSCNKYYLVVNIVFYMSTLLENVYVELTGSVRMLIGIGPHFFLKFFLRFKQASIYIGAAMNKV